MSRATHSVALAATTHEKLARHLLRADGQEDLCFALWFPSNGRSRVTALLWRPILPKNGERLVHGNASFLPGFFERALGDAIQAGARLAFIHSHPGPGWQGMSKDDVKAELGIAAATFAATGLPLVGLTLGNDGAWSARFWEKAAPRTYERRWCTTVRVVGERLAVTFADKLMPPPRLGAEIERTVSAWGEETQASLARLRVGIVGAGSVGTIVAEALARMGVTHIVLIDFDSVEFVNLDRLLHATSADAKLHRPKVACLGTALRRSSTAYRFEVDEIDRSIVEEDGFRAALDCDLLFSCVDRPWPRSALNFIAYAHLIPVVDGGIAIETTKDRKLRRADWRAHIAGPDHRCLECLGQYDPGLVGVEREGLLDDPRYIRGLPENHPVRRNENVFAFSLATASLEVLQMLMMIIAPMGMANAGAQMYHFVPGIFDEPDFRICNEGCPYPELEARGDSTGLIVTGFHGAAEEARRKRREV